MSDGSTDSAILEQEMMYIRFCHKGVINVKFLEVAELERGTAVNIKAAIEKALIKVDTSWDKKLVALGASVMQGNKGGVIALFKKDCPWCVVCIISSICISCFGHFRFVSIYCIYLSVMKIT